MSKDLFVMWQWLKDHTFEEGSALVKQLYPDLMTMDAWLRWKRGKPVSA